MSTEDDDEERVTAALPAGGARLPDRRSLREIAAGMFGAGPGSASGASRVDAEWHPDGWMRAMVRRRLYRSRLAAVRTGRDGPDTGGGRNRDGDEA